MSRRDLGGERTTAHQQALDAFEQAQHSGCADLADLYYNRAALHTFTQEFQAALDDYAHAQELDPTLPCDLQVWSRTHRDGLACGLYI